MFKLLLLLLCITLTPGHVHSGSELSVHSVWVKEDLLSQTLTVWWRSEASRFDIEIRRSDFEEVVFNETVSVEPDPVTGNQSWTWQSDVPLECSSHSIHIRARTLDAVSQWSPLLVIPGKDVAGSSQATMYPVDRAWLVGSNATVCCIVPSAGLFSSMSYMNRSLTAVKLSSRSYASTLTNLQPSSTWGTNAICSSETSILTGTVLFIGYPPGDEGLQCETRDLLTADCRWREGLDTNFWKKIHLTVYTLNGRHCSKVTRKKKLCHSDWWENSWTLVAKNPLGTVELHDSAHISHRVRLLAPVNVVTVEGAWQASVRWSWTVEAYKALELVCVVVLKSRGRSDTSNHTGQGLSSVLLDRLQPDTEYSFSVRCASLQHFWRWGDWSAPYSFHTKMDRPEAPDVWLWRSSESTGHVVWKALSVADSHGSLTAYEVYVNDGDGDGWRTISLPPTSLSYPISLSNTSADVMVALAARNSVGLSQRSRLNVPQFSSDSEVPVLELVGSRGGLALSWNGWSNASLGYVVEWVPTCCSAPTCLVQWERVSSSNTSILIQSGSLLAGVQYSVSVYALLPETTVLLQRYRAYGQELVLSDPVGSLSARQSGSDVVLSWKPVNMCKQSSFIRGYTIYLADASNLSLIANLSDSTLSSYRVKRLALGSYKFTVKSYSSAGEGSGSTIAIRTESDTDMMLLEILVSLGVMSLCLIIISIFCYKKREWVKKAFYPEIPGPKLTGDWSAPTAPLDVKPPPHSLVHIVESPDKEGLPLALEKQQEAPQDLEEENVEPDMDSDEPALLRYYNQLVSDGSGSGFSSSSEDSAQTQVTYTGIQSPAYKPQLQLGAQPDPEEEVEEEEEEQSAGYKPQSSWRATSPGHESFVGSLGSPTSVTSSQFLIPESPEEPPEPSGTWLQNLLSGKF